MSDYDAIQQDDPIQQDDAIQQDDVVQQDDAVRRDEAVQRGSVDVSNAQPVDLADAIARSVLGDITDPTREDHLLLVARAADTDRAARALLQETINSARSAGHSWAAIGEILGLTRQAVQQRFGGSTPATGAERWLGPVTAFDEMAELEAAGRLGWHTIGAGMLKHRMVRTDTQWEHRRTLWPAPVGLLHKDGWQIGCRAFPWVYLIRDTGQPVTAAE